MSVNQLTLDQPKPWLNVRVNNLTVDGTITGGGSGGPAILYQTPSTIDPPDNIIYKIGNADESSYLEMGGGCDIITPGNKMNVQCVQFNVDVVGSTARVTTDDTLTLEGRNLVVNVQDTTTIVTPFVNVTSDANTITSGATVFAGGGAVVMEGLGEFVNSQFDVKITTAGILNKKRYSFGTVTSGASGVWSYTHGLGQIPDFYIATALSSASLVQDQNIISYNTATNTVITGRVMQPAVVPSGGGAAMEYVTGVAVKIYCGML